MARNRDYSVQVHSDGPGAGWTCRITYKGRCILTRGGFQTSDAALEAGHTEVSIQVAQKRVLAPLESEFPKMVDDLEEAFRRAGIDGGREEP